MAADCGRGEWLPGVVAGCGAPAKRLLPVDFPAYACRSWVVKTKTSIRMRQWRCTRS